MWREPPSLRRRSVIRALDGGVQHNLIPNLPVAQNVAACCALGAAGKQTYPAINVNNNEQPSSFEKLPSNQFSSQLSEMTKLGRVENMPFEFFLVVSVVG